MYLSIDTELIEEYLEIRGRGDSVSIDRYIQCHPEYESDIRKLLPMLSALENGGMRKTVASTDDYEVLEEIARGGMGAVLRVRDRRLKRVLAMKVILEGQDAGGMRERFHREAELCGGLQHPGIVPIHELGQFEDGRPFYHEVD